MILTLSYTQIYFSFANKFSILTFKFKIIETIEVFFMMLLHLTTLSLHEDEEEFYMYIDAYMKDNFLYFQMPE
jgi:hypothetical protein